MNSLQSKTDDNAEKEEKDNGLTTRECALSMLSEVLDRKNALDVVLERSAEFASLPPRDRAFTRMLLTTTLRRLGQIDDLITHAQDRPNTIKTPTLLHILRLGVTQIFFMEVADHAAVDTSVTLCENHNLKKQKGFVNAILRTLIRGGKARLDQQDAGRLNTPEWLLKHWVSDYGMVEAAKIANAHLTEAPLDITVKSKDDRGYYGNALQASELSTGSLRRIGGGNIKELEGFDQGKWWVQDAAAAIPATLFGDIEGKQITDMCAAPGGKTMQLAALGANVTAIDRSAKRMQKVEENLERIGLKNTVKIEIADAANWTPKETPAYILLDAPCSATGTMRRHPDTGYLKSDRDIERLITIQTRLLLRAIDILAPGGTLIYCTCSLQKAEGEYQIEQALSAHQNMIRSEIKKEEIGGYESLINDQGDLRILPHHLSEHGGIDGFFVSRLVKV